MAITIVKDEDGFGETIIVGGENLEYIDPVSNRMKTIIESTIYFEKTFLEKEKIFLELDDPYLLQIAIKRWNEEYSEISNIQIPPSYIGLFHCQSKSDQIKILKGQVITPILLTAIEFMAFQKLGYKYSLYNFEKKPSGFDNKRFPVLMRLMEDDIKTVGKTDLSKGQQMQIMKQRKVIVSHFLDKGKEWHCFFSTYNGINGKENPPNGTPHFHYISDKWGLSREDVITRFKNGNYSSTPVHLYLNND